MTTYTVEVLEVAATHPDAYVWVRHEGVVGIGVGPVGELSLDKAADLPTHGFSDVYYAPGAWRMVRKVMDAS